jgi:hypothetical protein
MGHRLAQTPIGRCFAKVGVGDQKRTLGGVIDGFVRQ